MPVSADTAAGKTAYPGPGLERAFRLLNRSFETFYEKRYEQAVEFCGEALGHLLPGETGPGTSPEEKSALFMKTYAGLLPVQEAEGVAGVFTFFQSRKTRFRFKQGAPLPDRDWWQFIRIQRGEAEEVIQVTRQALNIIKDLASREG